MKKSLVVFLSIFSFFIIGVSNSFNYGMTIMTDENVNWALRTGFDSEQFKLHFDLSPDFGEELNIITITDLDLKLADLNDMVSLSAGILWLNDRPSQEYIDAGENRSTIFANVGFNFHVQNVSAKMGIGYPVSQDFEPTTNIIDYLNLRMTYTVPKPANFIDDLKLQFRFTKLRRDISIFISTPINE
jgi:hypothetical protein